ncbi:MAG: glycosyltransferase family 2 protein [Bacteroidales bacterium]
MDVSVVIPLYNEEESVKELVDWIMRVMKEHSFSFEVVLIDDGSSDKSWEVIESLITTNKSIKALKFRRNYGKSAALYSGFKVSEGDVVITMDADMQDDPEEIPQLYKMIKAQGYDLVSGWKKDRHDPPGKKVPSRFFNFTARLVTGIKLHDFNCGLKAYRNEVVKNIEVYGEMHRYIPMLVRDAGFANIGEKVVKHRKRKYGSTKFGMERFIKGFLDLLSLSFVSRFGKRPMHLFGTLGTLVFIAGLISAVYLGSMKLLHLSRGVRTALVTDSPYFYLSLTAMIMGTLLFLAGFIGEMIARNSPFKNSYEIEKKINL